LYPVVLVEPWLFSYELGNGEHRPVTNLNRGYDRQVMLLHVGPSIQHFGYLGAATGGQPFGGIDTAGVVPQVLKTLAKQVLQYTHVAGYYPEGSDRPKPHEAQVILLNKNVGQLTGGSRIMVH
jgi:hypothetical protein